MVCETDVVVQADDWLSKIAEKFYGDPLAYQAIADATNLTEAGYVGKSADDIGNQTGGWTLTWQGTGNVNADFPGATSIFARAPSGFWLMSLRCTKRIAKRPESSPKAARSNSASSPTKGR